MDIRPTAPGLVALQAVGDSWTIGQIVDSIDGLTGWEIASEITSAQGDIAEQVTVLLRKTYKGVTA
jgi:hypothetical protein